MNTPFNYLTINYPNIPVIGSSTETLNPVFGKFVPTVDDDRDDYDKSLSAVSSTDMYVPNFSLRILEGKFLQDAVLVNKEGEGSELLGSCLFLKGKVKSLLKGKTEAIESFQRQQNFKYDPENEFRHIVPADKPFHFLHFSYTAEYLYSILPEGEGWAEDLKTKIGNGQRVFGEKPLQITPLQERALQTIFDNPLAGKLGLMMLETAMVQIILIQLNGLFAECPNSSHCGVQKRDVEIMYDVREHICQTFLDEHSLTNLAMHFGINTNKLMNTFKKLFGKSIFEYIQELRMEHAQQLLREQNLQIAEVSRTVGYKNPNHFSSAFKRQFGYCPSRVA